MHVVTPASFRPGAQYDIQWSDNDAILVTRAGRDGRLRFDVSLGGSAPVDHHDATAALPGWHDEVTVPILAN